MKTERLKEIQKRHERDSLPVNHTASTRFSQSHKDRGELLEALEASEAQVRELTLNRDVIVGFPKWMQITDDPATWAKDGDTVLVVDTTGGYSGYHNPNCYCYWRPLCDIDYQRKPTMNDYDKLIELADAATQGEWFIGGNYSNGDRHVYCTAEQSMITTGIKSTNAAFIAAANPVTVKAMAERLKKAEQYADRADNLINLLRESGCLDQRHDDIVHKHYQEQSDE